MCTVVRGRPVGPPRRGRLQAARSLDTLIHSIRRLRLPNSVGATYGVGDDDDRGAAPWTPGVDAPRGRLVGGAGGHRAGAGDLLRLSHAAGVQREARLVSAVHQPD